MPTVRVFDALSYYKTAAAGVVPTSKRPAAGDADGTTMLNSQLSIWSSYLPGLPMVSTSTVVDRCNCALRALGNPITLRDMREQARLTGQSELDALRTALLVAKTYDMEKRYSFFVDLSAAADKDLLAMLFPGLKP
eukprot:4324827-Amphidinium_carterae.1